MRPGVGALLGLVALAGVVVYVLVDGGDDSERAEGPVAGRVAAYEGPSRLIAELPEVGRLTWRCDTKGRFAATLTLALPGSGVDISVASDGRQVFEGRRLDPPASTSRRGRLATPFEHVRQQSWRIRYHHKPAPMLASVRIRYASDGGVDCFVPHATTDVRTADLSTP
jgi:hypothetical protein